MRVMLDTNILVSAFVFQSRKIYAVIDHIVSHHELVLSSYVVDELITGDKDFNDVELEKPEIMTIAEFEKAFMSSEK